MQKKQTNAASKKRARLTPEQRAQRMQRIFFIVLAAIMILTMVIGLIATNF